MILSCSNICKSFGSDDIIKNASFHIESLSIPDLFI